MTGPHDTDGAPPSGGLLPPSWRREAHRLLVAPGEELDEGERALALRLARMTGTYASEFLQGGSDGPNPHRIETATAAAAYVRFVVAVLHDFGPASREDLHRWRRRLRRGERVDDPRVAAFREGYRNPRDAPPARPGEARGGDRGLREGRDVPRPARSERR